MSAERECSLRSGRVAIVRLFASAREAAGTARDEDGWDTGMDAFVRLFSNDFAPLRLARGLGMAAVNRIGPARRFFMQEAGGAVGDLPRLLKGEAL